MSLRWPPQCSVRSACTVTEPSGARRSSVVAHRDDQQRPVGHPAQPGRLALDLEHRSSAPSASTANTRVPVEVRHPPAARRASAVPRSTRRPRRACAALSLPWPEPILKAWGSGSACSTSRPSPRASTGSEALRNTIDLAQLTDALGYHRYWVAEHWAGAARGEMVGSIDPRCETIRGTHWPNKGRCGVWNSRRGKPSWPAVTQPHQQAGHMDASDPIRPSKNSCGTGAVHIWVPASPGRRKREHAPLTPPSQTSQMPACSGCQRDSAGRFSTLSLRRPQHTKFVQPPRHVVVRAEDVEITAQRSLDHEIDGLLRRPGAGWLFVRSRDGEGGEDEAGDQQCALILQPACCSAHAPAPRSAPSPRPWRCCRRDCRAGS